MPRFEDLYSRYQAQGLEIIGLNHLESQSTVDGFVQGYGVTHPVACVADASGYSFAVLSTCYVFRNDGELIWVGGYNAITDQMVDDWLNPAASSGDDDDGDEAGCAGTGHASAGNLLVLLCLALLAACTRTAIRAVKLQD